MKGSHGKTLPGFASLLLCAMAFLLAEMTCADVSVTMEMWSRVTSLNDLLVVDGAMTSPTARSKAGCVIACSVQASCQAVCWVPGSPGTCYLHSSPTLTPSGLEASHPGATYYYVSTATAPPTIAASSSCLTHYQTGHVTSGVYPIAGGTGATAYDMSVYCDMETQGGGWTVFQRRFNGSVDFTSKLWNEYVAGFGSPPGEYWLGLENIHLLTTAGLTKLRVDLGDWSGNSAYAEYVFGVGGASSDYTLAVTGYTGTAGDSLTIHNGMKFSTSDQDHDKSSASNCAADWGGPWWHNTCGNAKLNGVYYSGGGSQPSWKGVVWYDWHGSTYSLKTTSLKIKEP